MKSLFLIWFSFLSIQLFAQDPTRFSGEIEAIVNKEFEHNNEVPKVVFTGSSSIRMWKDLESTYDGYQVMNNGFGGSEFSDLIFYKEELIYRFNPDILFIYEGDNDLNSGKSIERILNDAELLLTDIKEKLPDTQIYLISPKPSLSRWQLKDDYIRLNKELNRLSNSTAFEQVTFIDVWTPMMDESGEVRTDLFIEDDLHMNNKGYAIWATVIGEYLPQK